MVNPRPLVVLIVCALTTSGVVHVVHSYQVCRNAVMFLDKGRVAKEQGDVQEAVCNLRWYVRLAPGDADGLVELGLLLADASLHEEAFETLERALRLDSTRTQARRKAVYLAIELGWYPEAEQHLEEYLLKTAPEDAELLELLGRCQQAKYEYEAAVDSFRSAVGHDPARLDAYRLLAGLLGKRLERPEDADTWMKKMVEANPRSCRACVLRGNYLRRKGAIEDAMAQTVKALELAPDHVDALCLASQCALDQQDDDRAREYALRGLEHDTEHLLIYALLAKMELRAGKKPEAIAWLQRGLDVLPGSANLLFDLANLLVNDGKFGEVRQIIAQLRDARYPEPLVTYLRGRVHYAEGKWHATSEIFENVRGALAKWPDLVKQVDYWLGDCYEHLENPDLRLTAFRRAAKSDPLWIPARVGLARSLFSVGYIDDALAEYREIVSLKGAPPDSWSELARLMLLRNLRLNRSQRRWDDFKQVLDQAARATPESARIPILRAEALVARDRLDEAERILVAALEKHRDHVELWRARAALAQRQRDWQRTAEILDEATERVGDCARLRLARAQYLTQRFGGKAKDRLRDLAEDTQDFSESDCIELWRELAAKSLRVGDWEFTAELYARVVQREPNSLWVRLLLFDLALRTKDASGIGKLLDEIERIEGKGAIWLYGSAVRLGLAAKRNDHKVIAQAQGKLAAARALRPRWSRPVLQAARLDDLSGNEDRALVEYLRAIELGERGPAAIHRVMELLYARQRYLEADRIVRYLQQARAPFSTDLGRMAAQVSLHLDDFERALELAKLSAAHSKNYRDYIWLGQVLSIVGQHAENEGRRGELDKINAEAEENFRQAVTLAEGVPDTWISLVQFLARTGQAEGARQAIKEIPGKIPAGPLPIVLAQCHEATGEPERAEKKYQEALAKTPRDATLIRQVAEFHLRTKVPLKAAGYLHQLALQEVRARQEDVVWARRELALMLVASGRYRSLQKSLRLVEQNLTDGSNSARDLRAKAIVLASFPSRPRRLEAIQLLEQVLDEPSTTVEDRFVLAGLHRDENNWSKFSSHMRGVLARKADDPRYLSTYAGALLDRDEVQEAERWLEKLDRIAPDAFPTVNLRARALARHRRFDEALKLLQGFVENPDGQPSDRTVRLGLAAPVVEALSRIAKTSHQDPVASRTSAEAEAMYRQYVARRPGEELRLASFFIRQGRVDEGLRLAENPGSDPPPPAVMDTIITLLRQGSTSADQLHRAEKILASALKKHDRSTPLLLALAELCTTRGHFQEAEAAYREILARDAGNVFAMNNLAVLLALQQKRLDEARQLIGQAINLSGPTSSLLDSRATVYRALGRSQEAIADLEKATMEAPAPIRYFHLALLLQETKQERAAVKAFKEAQTLGLGPEDLHPLERPALEKLRLALQ